MKEQMMRWGDDKMLFSNMNVFWLVLMIGLLILEAIVPGLISIWFALGALVSLIAALLHAPVWLQFAIFGVSSAAFLAVSKPLIKKYVNSRVQPTNADMIIGKECFVTEEIDNISGKGAVSIGGNIWTARSTDDKIIIPAGSKVTVIRIEGVKAIVSF